MARVAWAEPRPPATPPTLDTPLARVDLPFRVRHAVDALATPADGRTLRLSDLMRIPPERFAPEVARMIAGLLQPYDLRYGPAAAAAPSVDPAGSPPDPPGAADPLAGLSLRLRAELARLKLHSAADFSARFTFSQLYRQSPMPEIWVEMINYCADEGHPVRSGARASSLSCADETAALTKRAQDLLTRLHVTDAADFAARHSLMSLGREGIGMHTMQLLMDWAATCGAPLAVTEAERLGTCPQALSR